MARGSTSPALARYAMAAALSAIALAARLALTPLFGSAMPLMTFIPVVMASAWLGGFGPGLFATAAGAGLATLFLRPVDSPVALTRLLLYGCICILISRLAANYRRVSAEARASREHLRELLDSIGDGFAALDASGRFHYVNGTAEKLIGKSAGELTGRQFQDVFPEFAGTPAESAFLQAVSERRPASVEFPGSSGLWLEFRIFPARDGRTTLYFSDISLRKRVEEDLAAARRQSEDILNSIRESFIALDREWRFTWLNDRAAQSLGAGREELIGKNFWEIAPEAKQTPFWPHCHTVMEQRIPQAFEVSYPDGRWYEVHAYPSGQGLTAYILDITDRKLAELQVKRRDEELNILTDNVPVIVSYLGPDGCFRRVNRVYEEVFGRPAESVVGRHLRDVGGEPHWSIARPWFERAVAGERVSFESRILHQDGHLREVQVTYTPLRGIDGSIEGITAMVADVTERKRAEVAVRASEERYRFLSDALPQLIWTRDAEGRIDYVNRHWTEYSGLTLANTDAAAFLELVHPDDRAHVEKALGGMDPEHGIELECRFRRADGIWRWHLARERYFEADRRWLATAIDIDDRKRAEEALRAAEQQLRVVNDAMPALIAYVDANGIYRFNNKTYERWFGLSPEEMRGRHVRDVIGEEAYLEVLPRIRAVLAGHPQTFEAELPYKRGPRYVQIAYVPDFADDGTVRGYFALIEDNSERKQAEQALRASERRYSALAETMPAIVWTAGPDGGATWFNSQWMSYTGVSARESLGHAWRSRLHPEMEETIARHWSQAVAAGEPIELEYLLRGRYGEYRWFLSRAVPVRDDHGEIVQWLGTSTDIDDRKRAEAELLASNETLRAFINACPLAVMVVEENGVVRLWNKAAELLYGWSEAEVLGRNLPELMHGDPADKERALRRIFSGETLTGSYGVRYRRDGTAFDARVWTALLSVAPGQRQCLAIVADVTEEKRAEAALRESEARFRTMADHAPVLVWMAGPQQEGIWFNRPWREFTGHTPEQDSSYGWIESVHADDRERRLATYNRAFERREPFTIEYRLRRSDGQWRWVLDHGVPLLTDDGSFNGYIGSCIDITERRDAEEAMRQSEERLRVALSAARMTTWDQDLQSGAVTWSEPGTGRVHPDDQPRVAEAVAASVKENAPYEAEYRMIQPDGSVRWILEKGHVVRDASGAARRLLGVALDTTDRRRAEEALRRSEERLRLAQEASEIGIWDWDLRTGAVSWSPEMYEFLGLGSDVTPSAPPWEASIHPEDRQRALAARDHAIQRLEPFATEFRIVRPDGNVRWLLSRGRPVSDESGRAVRLVGVSLDLTERRMVEERLLQTNAELEQYAYAASHDLQEPLRMVRLYSELLSRRYADVFDADARTWFGYIASGASRMQTLIDDLLAYSLVISDRERHFVPVDMTAVVQTAEQALKVAIAESGGTIEYDVLPHVHGEFAALTALMQNLLSNAIKYRRPGEPPRIRVHAESDGEFWQFAVQDNGIGIRPEYHNRIFGVFKRLHGRQVPGTGIGLAICKRTVEQHGGRIWVDSDTGRGSTFFFTLRSAAAAVEATTSN